LNLAPPLDPFRTFDGENDPGDPHANSGGDHPFRPERIRHSTDTVKLSRYDCPLVVLP
jgi:hypothetical protein